MLFCSEILMVQHFIGHMDAETSFTSGNLSRRRGDSERKIIPLFEPTHSASLPSSSCCFSHTPRPSSSPENKSACSKLELPHAATVNNLVASQGEVGNWEFLSCLNEYNSQRG